MRAKKINIFISICKWFPFHLVGILWKKQKNNFFVFLSSFRLKYLKKIESLRKLRKAVETITSESCSQSISSFPGLPLVYLTKHRMTEMFSLSLYINILITSYIDVREQIKFTFARRSHLLVLWQIYYKLHYGMTSS